MKHDNDMIGIYLEGWGAQESPAPKVDLLSLEILKYRQENNTKVLKHNYYLIPTPPPPTKTSDR